MICAMGAISILGFIVWAYSTQMGFQFRELLVIKFCYMLERLYAVDYGYVLQLCVNVKRFIGYPLQITDQSAGNYLYLSLIVGTFGFLSPSETTRKMSVNSLTDPFMNPYVKHNQKQDLSQRYYPSWFVDWFVGFTEGDGGFYINSSERRLFFKIRQADPKILHYIKNYFGFGSVTADADGYYSYAVSAQADILVLFNLFNGKLVLGKVNDRFVT